MKLLVCGGRDFADRERLFNHLSLLVHMNEGIDQIIHGGAGGADSLAGEWAAKFKVPCRVFPANWKLYGKSAGPIRNQQMLDEGKPDVVVAFPGGRGTENMVMLAERAGVPVIRSNNLLKGAT